VKNADVTELMAFLGLFGAIIAAIQMYPSNNKAIIFLFILNFYEHFPWLVHRSIFERGAVRAIQWSTEAVSMLLHSLSISAN